MYTLLKKAERKKRRRNKYMNSIEKIDTPKIVKLDITDIIKQNQIVKLNEKTNLNTSYYNNSNIISNIEDYNYKSLDYIINKYE